MDCTYKDCFQCHHEEDPHFIPAVHPVQVVDRSCIFSHLTTYKVGRDMLIEIINLLQKINFFFLF